jgi:hypothetical protein
MADRLAPSCDRCPCGALKLALPWNFSGFWYDRTEWPWNSRGCETINPGCLATELLPCECVMRRPIASLCWAPMALGFDRLLSRFEPRSFVFSSQPLLTEIDNAVTPVNAPNQTSCAVGMTKGQARHSRARCSSGTKPKFFNDFSRARMRVRARGTPFKVSGARRARVVSGAIATTLSRPHCVCIALDNELVDLGSGYQRLIKLTDVVAHQFDVRPSRPIRSR